MDNEKTGKLIAKIRQQKKMTQQDIADRLHITSKAVSKWERGLSFPSVDVLEQLAEVLEVSVVDILSGEIVQTGNVAAQADEVSLQVLRKEQKTRKKLIISLVAGIAIFLFLVLSLYSGVISQRGNPLPYLLAALNISDGNPYVEVWDNSGVYISKRGECPELLKYVEDSKNMELVEHEGGSYIFSNGIDSIAISEEIYLKYFTVWSVPQITLHANIPK